MAFEYKNNESGFADFNKFIASRSYVDGYLPSQSDVSIFKQISNINSVDSNKYPHFIRWFHHINGFTPSQRSRFHGAVKEEKKGSVKVCSKTSTCDKSSSSSTSSATCDKNTKCDKTKVCDAGDKTCDAVDKGGDKEAAEEEEKVMGWSDSDDESEKEAQRIIDAKAAEKLARDAASGKKAVIAKSTLILDVKPDGSETDMVALEANVRAIEMEGLDWKGSELVPVAYGVKKLRIISVIVDDLVSTDDLRERIEQIEDVQSTDIYAFNKV